MYIDGIEYKSIEDTAKEVGYTLKTLEQYLFTKKIPGRKLMDGRIVFTPDDIKRIKEIKAGKHPVSSAPKPAEAKPPQVVIPESVKVDIPPESARVETPPKPKATPKQLPKRKTISFQSDKGKKIIDCVSCYAHAKGISVNKAVEDLLAEAIAQKKAGLQQLKQLMEQEREIVGKI